MEGFEPRPDASKQVAAAHRARQDDEAPELTTPATTRAAVPFGIGALLVTLLMIGMASYQLSRAPGRPLAITPAPTDAPAQAFSTGPKIAPTAAPAPTSAPTALPRTIGAYAAPDGALLGQIAADRAIVPVAHYGTGWIAYQDGTGLVWLRASDVPGLALVGPDLAPIAAQPQTGQGLTVDTTVWVPAATPVPPAAPTAAPIVYVPLRIRAEDDCTSEHGRCDAPCTAEHGRCSAGDE